MATLQTLPEAATLLPPASAGAPMLAARSFFYSVFKHRRLVIGIFLLVFLVSATVALLRPRTWRATTKVLVKVGEAVQLAPAEAPSRSINLPLNPDVVAGEAGGKAEVFMVRASIAVGAAVFATSVGI